VLSTQIADVENEPSPVFAPRLGPPDQDKNDRGSHCVRILDQIFPGGRPEAPAGKVDASRVDQSAAGPLKAMPVF